MRQTGNYQRRFEPRSSKANAPSFGLIAIAMIAVLFVLILIFLAGRALFFTPPESTPTPTAMATFTPGAPLVTLGPPPTLTPQVFSSPTPFVVTPIAEKICYANKSLWVSAKPINTAVGIAELAKGQEVKVVGNVGDWYQVIMVSGQQTGYILQKNLICP